MINVLKKCCPATPWQRVFVGLLLGLVLGFVLQERTAYLKPLGDIFIRLIKMVIVPLVFFAIVGGMTHSRDTKSIHSIGIKAIGAYTITTFFATVIGLFVGHIFAPGSDLHLQFGNSKVDTADQTDPFSRVVHILCNVIPDNAVGSMAHGNVLQVVFFSLFVGFTVNKLKERDSERLADIFSLCSRIVFKMVELIVCLSPVAACAFTAWVVGSQGMHVLRSLASLIACIYCAFFIQYIVFGIVIYFWSGLSPKPFYQKSLEYQILAFATSSSKAALATTIRVCRKRLGISSNSASFVLPLGAAINMDGIAIYLGLCSIFFAQVTHITLTPIDYAVIILTSTLGSIGAAGVPGGTMIMLPMVLSAVGLPVEGIALVVGVDRIIDMMRTTISITGDVAVTLCVDHSEGLLREDVYYSPDV